MDEEKPTNSREQAKPAAGGLGSLAADTRREAAPLQTGLDWRPDGSVAMVEAPPAGKWNRPSRQAIRNDARRTAEYLASRGKTPAEVLHDVVKLGMARAIALIAKETGCTRLQALDRWQAMTEALLPYTAARFETIELGPNAAGGLALGHFLAASAMSQAIAERRDSGASQVPVTLDATSEPGLPFHDNGLAPSQNGDNPAIKARLPPKAPD